MQNSIVENTKIIFECFVFLAMNYLHKILAKEFQGRVKTARDYFFFLFALGDLCL